MRKFRQRFAHMGSGRGISALVQELDNAIINADLHRSLAFLNELEIETGASHPDYSEYEAELDKAFEIYAKNLPDTDATLLGQGSGSIASYKNLHRGERCFILGTGPSLSQVDPELLRNEITFGMNFLCKAKSGFSPTYYVAEDPRILEYCAEDIAAISQGAVFLPNYAKRLVPANNNQVYLNCSRCDSEKAELPFFGIDAEKRIWLAGTAGYMALQLALYMGFSRVYLLGFDHDYQIPASSLLSVDNEIIYQEEDKNHFPPASFPQDHSWRLPRLDRLDLAYEQAAYVYGKKGSEIVNCTPHSKLDVFPKSQLEEVLKTPG